MILVHVSDLHVRPRGETVSRVVESSQFAERALRAIASFRPRPDAVVISGDLTDCGLESEYKWLLYLLDRHLGGLRVLLIPGNHDRRENFRAVLGRFEGVTSDPDFIQYVVEDLPVRLIMLDSIVPGAGHGELCARRLAWLEARLNEAPQRPTLIALHHPPLCCGLQILDTINLRSTPELGALLRRHPQVERILCGHHHRSMIGRLGHATVCVAPGTAQAAAFELDHDRGDFVMEPPGYYVHLRNGDGSIVSHLVFVEAFPGPYPYILDGDYPGGADVAAER
ncbi:MAG: phosphodiesterase [Alphaproteobacteria bacterium]|nr:phosphodiesterase [Alphaproteobacteria bacterium]